MKPIKMMSLMLGFAFAAALPPSAISLAAVPPPHVSVAAIADLPQPLPVPYDETASGMIAVAHARALARRQHKTLLIDLGGNWCTDCRVLAGIMALPEVSAFVARHFVVVKVDIGRYDRNGDVARHYGLAGRLDGVPAILVVDPARDRLINRGNLFALTDARHMVPQALADWLAQWVA